LVVDSVRTLRGRLRYSVAVCVFMAALLERLHGIGVVERTRFLIRSGARKG
jgi:hypothetical protein